jgi:hypothetical protein
MCNSTTTTATLTTHRLAFSSTSDDRATQRSCNTQQTNSLQARPVVTLRCRALTQQANSRNDERCCDGDEEGEGDEEEKKQQQQEEGRRKKRRKKTKSFPAIFPSAYSALPICTLPKRTKLQASGWESARAREAHHSFRNEYLSLLLYQVVGSGCCIRL